MVKMLFVLGSPREGNSSFALDKITQELDCSVLKLKDMNIKHCTGCLSCMKNSGECVIKDDMKNVTEKLLDTETIVLVFPSYFGNFPGILKDFVDRTNPFYYEKMLAGKRLVSIIIGGQSKEISQKALGRCIPGFAEPHGIEHIKSFIFQADSFNDLRSNPKESEKMKDVVTFLRDL